MPFVLPCIAVGSGVGLIVWGSKMLLSNNDSADKFLAKLFIKIPHKFREHVKNIDISPTGISINFHKNTSPMVKDEFERNIKVTN